MCDTGVAACNKDATGRQQPPRILMTHRSGSSGHSREGVPPWPISTVCSSRS
ncbi:hypothetical protein MLP_22930 [Microlunatus phosphovorus NM-1]|uniref:Uncharacterized protein n=1 Tax=Microlunatus phosphovorus (strain ATCC 700054 / DSM 10555 / JCM 9379 / NBRC 101784 / NCIMB 13414 / VKM Ac-1990 / NM-1) TaxID=1032480 RepID=F5XEU1_MICPN|nr:hypothetical protein MLP_22930 [Microlunatus phosphovorus NM-1]